MRFSLNRFPRGSLPIKREGLARRIILGILIMALGVVLLVSLDTASMDMPLRTLVAGIFAVLVFGGLGYILGIAWMALYGVWLVLATALPDLLPQPWSGLCLVALLAIMVGMPYLFVKRKKKDAPEEEELLPEEEFEESPFPYLFAERNDSLYQLMRGDECIYVISLGDKLLPKADRAIAAPEAFTPGCGRRKIDFGDIDTVHVSIEEDGAHIRLRTWEKSFRWDTSGYTPDEIKAFFDGLPLTFVDKVNRLTKAQKNKKESLKGMCRVLRIASWIAGLLFLFVGRPYRTLAIVNLAIPVIYLVIYALNLSHWDLFGAKERENMTFACWFLSVGALSLRALMDFNFPHPAQLILPMVIAAAAGILSFFLLSIRHKKQLKRVLCLLLCIAIYVPGCVVMVNYLLPVKSTEAHIGTVAAKDIHSGSRSPNRYEITLVTHHLGTLEVNTAPEIYDQIAVGGEAVYLLDTSLLGIQTGDVYPMSWLEGDGA